MKKDITTDFYEKLTGIKTETIRKAVNLLVDLEIAPDTDYAAHLLAERSNNDRDGFGLTDYVDNLELVAIAIIRDTAEKSLMFISDDKEKCYPVEYLPNKLIFTDETNRRFADFCRYCLDNQPDWRPEQDKMFSKAAQYILGVNASQGAMAEVLNGVQEEASAPAM